MICSSSASTCSSAMPSNSLRVSMAAMVGGQGSGALEQAARCCSGDARVSQSARFNGRDARVAGEGGGGGDDWCWTMSMAGGGVGGARSSS